MITSMQNPLIRSFVALHDAKGRKEAKAFLIEGLRFVEEAVEARAPFAEVVYVESLTADERGARLLRSLDRTGVKLVEVDERVLRVAAQTKTPQGLVAKLHQPALTHAPAWTTATRLIVVDRVQDPGNLGTIIRTAAANAMDGVYLLAGTVDLHNDKVLRSTMGALFRVPIYTEVGPDEIVRVCNGSGLRLTVAMMHGAHLPHEARLSEGIALVVGNEGAGVCQALIEQAGQTVRIPMPGEAESLNVAVAAGILMYESTRQLLTKAHNGNDEPS